MFKDNRLQIFGAFICFFSVIYAISYYDIYKGIQACNLCILDRYIFVAIGIIFSLSIWAKKKLLFLPLILVSFLLSCFGFIVSARHIWLQKTSENNQNKKKGIEVTSPIIGTAYHAPEPGAKKFIEVGKKIKKGDTIMIVEAMKTMNHVPSTSDGVVKQIIVSDGQPVEFGQVLITLE